MSAPRLQALAPQAPWLLRLAVLGVFPFHGVDTRGNLVGLAETAGMPVFVALLVALAEAVGALLVFAGGFLRDWMTRLGAAMIVPVMLGAIAMVHWGQWHFMATESHPMGGMQFQVTLLTILLYFVLRGNGEVDRGVTRA